MSSKGLEYAPEWLPDSIRITFNDHEIDTDGGASDPISPVSPTLKYSDRENVGGEATSSSSSYRRISNASVLNGIDNGGGLKLKGTLVGAPESASSNNGTYQNRSSAVTSSPDGDSDMTTFAIRESSVTPSKAPIAFDIETLSNWYFQS